MFFSLLAYALTIIDKTNNWFMLSIVVIGALLKIFFSSVQNLINNIGTVTCPKCKNIIEKSQILGNPIPKKCPNCSLEIKSSNKFTPT